jgi:hypothetical protein
MAPKIFGRNDQSGAPLHDRGIPNHRKRDHHCLRNFRSPELVRTSRNLEFGGDTVRWDSHCTQRSTGNKRAVAAPHAQNQIVNRLEPPVGKQQHPMAVDDHNDSVNAQTYGRQHARLFFLAALLVLAAWIISRCAPAADPSRSFTATLLAAGALPWFLQWAGVILAITAFSSSPVNRVALAFAAVGSFMLAAVWWCGIVWRFWGMGPLDELTELATYGARSAFGTAPMPDELLFGLIGPVVGPLQLRGPFLLKGWNFLLSLLSTGVLVGYLAAVGRWCRLGAPRRSAQDYIKFLAAMLLCFSPAFIRLAIQIARAHLF